MNRFWKAILSLAAILLCLFLASKALPYIAPFLLSLTAAAIMEPAVTALHRRGVSRSIAAGIMSGIILFLAAGIISVCAVGGAQLLTFYAGKAPALLTSLNDTADKVQQQFATVLRAIPDELEQQILTAADGFSAQLSEFPAWLSEKALDGVSVFAKQSPDWILFLCTSIIGIYFFSAYFRDICSFFRRQLPEATQKKLSLLRKVIRDACAGYLKVQCILSGVTFLILLAAFWMMGLDGKITAALGIAVIDALPILGSGVVLLPWAIIALITGKLSRAAALLSVYAILLVTHNVLQAKLMGSHLGLHPVTALVSLYVGWKLAGLAGMILLPIVCVLLCSLNDAGIIRLYQ